ncbi:MAG: TadE family protein [Sneathiella sp.]
MGKRSTINHTLQSLNSDDAGTTAVELALLMPVIMLVIFGMIELSIGMFVNTVVEGGLRDASRIGLTGQDTGAVSREQTMVNIVNEASLGLVDAEAGDVDSLIYPSFEDVGMPEPFTDINGDGIFTEISFTFDGILYPDGEPFSDINGNATWDEDMGETGLGEPGDIVMYTLTYNWNLLSGNIIPVLDGVIPMTASMIVQNEPF